LFALSGQVNAKSIRLWVIIKAVSKHYIMVDLVGHVTMFFSNFTGSN